MSAGSSSSARATLDDVTEAKVARDGFDWVWLLGVWQTGEAGPGLAVGTPARPAWDGAGGRLLAVVNFGPTHAPCYVRLAFGDFSARSILLTDLVHPTIRYERQRDAVTGTGLSLDLPPRD
ncbi:MAG: hypothetical protein ABW216_21995 [Candidatus Rokuibacteriota bacterium]